MSLDLDDLAALPDSDLIATLEKLVEHKRYNRLDFYEPYAKQMEFHALGATKQERMLSAGNQMGKSYAGAAETAIHLTGFYPEWWNGRVWRRPVRAWAASESTTVSRDVAQTLLCGDAGVDEAFGTGFIPRHCFAAKPTLARGAVSDAYDLIQVYHHNESGERDGVSTLKFKSYEQGRKKFQGPTLDFVWWDEEPDEEIYIEGNARWSATGGMSFMTFTPLLGYSTVVCLFLRMKPGEELRRAWVRMGYKDSLHMTPEKVADLLSKYPKYQHNARIEGEPLLGSGQVYLVDLELLKFPTNQRIPEHLAKLWGLDFGITHPFAATLIAWDRDEDVIYVLTGYKAANAIPMVHAEAMNRIATGVPVAWPHDGHNREKGTGESLAKQYKPYLKMLPTHSTWPDGSMSTEAAVTELDDRMHKGGGPGGIRFREDFEELFSEIRMYHRKDGLLVKESDDLLSSLYKALMMKRYARPGPIGYKPRLTPEELREQRVLRSRPKILNPWTGRPLTSSRPYGM